MLVQDICRTKIDTIRGHLKSATLRHAVVPPHGVRDERLCVARVWNDRLGRWLPEWPELVIPTLKPKGLGYVGDPTPGGDPRMGGGDPRIYKKIQKIPSSTLDF